MAISGDDLAQITARCGVARCGTSRCGCAPNDIVVAANGATGVIAHESEDSLFSTSEGTVVEWGVGGAGGGVDELPQG